MEKAQVRIKLKPVQESHTLNLTPPQPPPCRAGKGHLVVSNGVQCWKGAAEDLSPHHFRKQIQQSLSYSLNTSMPKFYHYFFHIACPDCIISLLLVFLLFSPIPECLLCQAPGDKSSSSLHHSLPLLRSPFRCPFLRWPL